MKEQNHNKKIGCWSKKDFDFVLNYYFKEINKLLKEIKTKNKKQLIKKSEHAFYLYRFIYDMKVYSYKEIGIELEKAFLKQYGTKNILLDIQKKSLHKAVKKADGQYLLGENNYTLKNDKIFYRNLFGEWFKISENEVFLLFPKFSKKVGSDLAEKLEKNYKPSAINVLFNSWTEENWPNSIKNKTINIQKGETTPEKYFQTTTKQINNIIENPVSYQSLKNYFNVNDFYMEKLIKVCYRLIVFVSDNTNRSCSNLYLLRDGMLFAEAQKAIDILFKRSTHSNQILISRNLLSKKNGDEYFWNLTVEAFYDALQKHPNNYILFFKEYSKKLKNKEKNNPDLKSFFQNLSEYIYKTIEKDIKLKKTIVTTDVGLQGSIVNLTKYLIDNHICSKYKTLIKTDVRMFIVAGWLKGLYKKRYYSDYYPMMKDIEPLIRSEELYYYL